jgi:hypothetical protein
MPTAALAVIDLKIGTWASIEAGIGKLKTVVRPKDELKTKEKGT